MTNSLDDLRDAACILAIGTNTTEAHPVIGMNMRQSVRAGKTRLIVANPLKIGLVGFADLWLQHRAGTDVPLLMGMMKVIVDEDLADKHFIEERCENFDAFKASLADYTLDRVEEITGVPADLIVKAARMYAENSPAAICYTMGITQHTHGTDNVMATANLAMLTGNVGKPGSGVNPLRGQNNVQGACDVGALPNVYPGYQSVTDEKVQQKFREAWGSAPGLTAGLTLSEIIPAAHDGSIKAIYLMGENPSLSDPDGNHVREALQNLEFFIVQDIFLNETAQYADVVLPACSFAEKDGTFTNTERRVQRVREAIPPVGESRPDWWIAAEIAKRMGASGYEYADAAAIMDEIARLTPSYGGISFARLEEGSLQWPCPTPEHPGTPILHTKTFSRGKGHFVPLTYRPPMESPDETYPLVLTTDRSLFHYHTGTMTRKVRGLNTFRSYERVAISPADAGELGIAEGDAVRVTSRRGSVTARAWVTESSPKGTIAMTFHFAESPTNELTNPAYDPASKTPELKVSAVRVEKVARAEPAEVA